MTTQDGWTAAERNRWARAEKLREERAAEWQHPDHPRCCHRCGWHVSSHGISSYGLDCPNGASPAHIADHLPPRGTISP